MAILTTEEIQYAIDRRKTVDISSGAIVGKPVQLAHVTGDILITNKSGNLTYDGPPGRHVFEWNWSDSYVHNPGKLTISDVDFRGTVVDAGFLRISGSKPPLKTTVSRCTVRANRGYAFDANGVGDCQSVWFEDIQSYGAGAIRWIGLNRNCVNHAWFDSWRHIGSNRIGASFMFKNMRNVLADNLIEDGTPSLADVCKNVYYGPIAVHAVNCSGHNRINDYWLEPWGEWDTDAPGCWGFEVRADETSGYMQPHVFILRNVSLNSSGLGAGTKLMHCMGGDTSNSANRLRVDFEDFFDLVDGTTLFGGKVFAVAKRATKVGSEYSTSDMDDFTNYQPSSFRDRWNITSFAHPYQVYADRVSYEFGAANFDETYTSEPSQPDA